MNTANDQVAQLQAAIDAFERQRATVGDEVVDTAIAALREQLDALRIQERGAGSGRAPTRAGLGGHRAELASQALESLRSHLPPDLEAKARAAPAIEGERKQVTVLFADLSGFTTISERSDPELIRDFQTDLFRELARLIYQYEGFVEKFVGDAILAVFGAPVAHEDDPERALRVALAMRERIAVLNRRWSERLGARVTLHIGVNTGLVVAGKIGSDLDSDGGAYAVSGDTVNSAARLQNAAQPGQILVSRTTYRLAQEAFTFQALEPVQVKNRREPLDVYELTRARYLPGKMRGVRELGQSFVGREAVLAQLEAVITSLGEGESARTVLITGEAGLGKSRLVAELCKSTRDRVLWLEGRCFAHTQMLPYGPFLDMLRRDAGILDDDSQASLTR
jgi:class 3 adenylate cyclase